MLDLFIEPTDGDFIMFQNKNVQGINTQDPETKGPIIGKDVLEEFRKQMRRTHEVSKQNSPFCDTIAKEVERGKTPERTISLKDGSKIHIFADKDGNYSAYVEQKGKMYQIKDFKLSSIELDGGSTNFTGQLPNGIKINGKNSLEVRIDHSLNGRFPSSWTKPGAQRNDDCVVNNEVVRREETTSYKCEYSKDGKELLISRKSDQDIVETANSKLSDSIILYIANKSSNGSWNCQSAMWTLGK